MATPLIVSTPGQSNTQDTRPGNDRQMFGPFTTGGNVYIPLCDETGVDPMTMNKSADNGVTYTVQDSANAPAGVVNFGCVLDGTTLIVAYCTQPVGGSLRVTTFDTVTNTWSGVIIATAIASLAAVTGMSLRVPAPALDVLILYITFHPGTTWSYFAIPTDGVTFGASFTIDNNFDLPMHGGSGFSQKSCVDSAGGVHVFTQFDAATNIPHRYYQRIETTNTLGTFFEFTDVIGNDTLTGTPVEDPITDSIIWPYNDSIALNLVIKIGTPTAAPVWPLGSTTVDTITPPVNHTGVATRVNGILQVCSIQPDSAHNTDSAIRLSQSTTPGGPWTAVYALDGSGPTDPGSYLAAQVGDDGAGNPLLIIDAASGGLLTGFSFITGGITPPDPPLIAYINAGALPSMSLPNPSGKC